MKPFLDENFLLTNKTAQQLYHSYAKTMPVIDYHCHLSPKQIAEDHQFQNLTQVWLAGDHYKWRAMRTNGVDESYCTGNKTDEEKFEVIKVTGHTRSSQRDMIQGIFTTVKSIWIYFIKLRFPTFFGCLPNNIVI